MIDPTYSSANRQINYFALWSSKEPLRLTIELAQRLTQFPILKLYSKLVRSMGVTTRSLIDFNLAYVGLKIHKRRSNYKCSVVNIIIKCNYQYLWNERWTLWITPKYRNVFMVCCKTVRYFIRIIYKFCIIAIKFDIMAL